jgi:hypothetical protein
MEVREVRSTASFYCVCGMKAQNRSAFN